MGDEGTSYQDLHRAIVKLNDAAQAVQLVNSVPVPNEDEANRIRKMAREVAKLAGGVSKAPMPSPESPVVEAVAEADEVNELEGAELNAAVSHISGHTRMNVEEKRAALKRERGL